MKKAISLVLALSLGLSSISLAVEDTWVYKSDINTWKEDTDVKNSNQSASFKPGANKINEGWLELKIISNSLRK